MSNVVRLELNPRRLLNTGQAANYVGLAFHDFKSRCPVRPFRLAGGHYFYDIHDLDSWIDQAKAENFAGAAGHDEAEEE